jgi:hypothetical protein
MSEFSLQIAVEHPVLFLSDPSLDEAVPPDTGAAAVTSTEDCVCFWVQSYVDGEAVVTISDRACGTGEPIFSGRVASPSRSLALSDSNRFTYMTIPVADETTSLQIWMSDPEQLEWVWVKLPIRGF